MEYYDEFNIPSDRFQRKTLHFLNLTTQALCWKLSVVKVKMDASEALLRIIFRWKLI